jgi:integrase
MVEEEALKRVRRVTLLEENNRRLRYLSKEECQRPVESSNDRLKPIVTMALNTGMRLGEILSLKWDNVDLVNGFILLDKTKNGERRELPINATLRATLEALPRRLDGSYLFFDPKTGGKYGSVKTAFNGPVSGPR